jgi:serine/threonine protein kinase
LDTGIPEENPSIPAGVPPKIEEATVGSMLGQGASGEVYVLNEPDSRISVLKCIPKALHTRLRGILAIKNEISIMQRFSSKEQRHPNIVGLQQVYLSCSHVFLKMDYGGPETLAQRLNRRDNGTLDCAMPLRDSLSVVSQCVSALYHLHNIAKIAHRDLKTDNIIYAETKIGSQIKVADFGLASCCTDDTVCFKRCGTFVFLAPEVILEESYNACVADVWSMGIVFLEILFFSKFPEAVLFRGCRGLSDEQAMEKVRSRLGASESLRVLIQTYLRPEYRGNGASGYRMLLGMLNVVAGDRSKASEAFSSCAEFVAQVGKSDEMKTDIIQGDYEANLSMCDVF